MSESPPLSEPPRRLRDELIGQEAVFERIERALLENRLGHAYLLLGLWGSGRTRTALALAQMLLCLESPAPGAPIPCGLCSGCRKTARIIHPDLHLIPPAVKDDAEDPDRMARLLEVYAGGRYHLLGSMGAASIGIDRLRRLKEEASKALVEGKRRIIILSSAERMTEQAAQSVLKLVEEPPPETVLILTAEDPAQLLPTLVSRCQRMHVRPLSRDVVASLLTDDVGLGPAEAKVLASLSGGSLGRALELKQSDALELRDSVIRVFAFPAPGSGERVSPQEVERRVRSLERIWTAESARRAGHLLLVWLRDLLVLHCGLEADSIANIDHAEDSRRLAARLSVEEIGRRICLVEEMVQAVDQYVNPVLALHATLTRIATGRSVEDISL